MELGNIGVTAAMSVLYVPSRCRRPRLRHNNSFKKAEPTIDMHQTVAVVCDCFFFFFKSAKVWNMKIHQWMKYGDASLSIQQVYEWGMFQNGASSVADFSGVGHKHQKLTRESIAASRENSLGRVWLTHHALFLFVGPESSPHPHPPTPTPPSD